MHRDATEPTKVTMSCSLGVLSLLATRGTLENLESGREVVAMAVENFRGTVRGKDQCSGIPTVNANQTFHMPKSVEIYYLSVNAFRRYRRIVRHYRTAVSRGLWSKAVGEPVASLVDGNRPRKATKDDDADVNDQHLTRDMKIFELLMVASGDRSSNCINRYHRNLPCYCTVESIWYSKDNPKFVVWDLEDLESLCLPHKNSNHVMFCVKNYLPVRWIAANPTAFRQVEAPTEESLKGVVEEYLPLCSVFSVMMAADEFVENSWERSSDDPRMRARMIDVVYKVARQHHDGFAVQYSPFQLSFSSKIFISVTDYLRQPFTGGLRPRERKTAEQQRAELLRVNVNRVMHETYCQMKDGFAPLPSFKKRLNEQFTILEERARKFNESIEQSS